MFRTWRKTAYLNNLQRCSYHFYNPLDPYGSLNVVAYCGKTCCPKFEKKRNTLQTQNGNMPAQMRKANYIANVGKGTPTFAYGTASSPYEVNYLGRSQGQSGGSGRPPRNVLI